MYEVRGKKLPEKYYKPSSLAYSCLPTLQHGCEVGDRCKKSQRFCTQFPANKMPPALVVMTILKKSANIKPVPTLKEEKGTSSFQYTPMTNLTYSPSFLQLHKIVQYLLVLLPRTRNHSHLSTRFISCKAEPFPTFSFFDADIPSSGTFNAYDTSYARFPCINTYTLVNEACLRLVQRLQAFKKATCKLQSNNASGAFGQD